MDVKEAVKEMKNWIEYEKANKDKIIRADELIEIQETILTELEKKDKYIDFYKKGLEREIESNRGNVLELIEQDNLLAKKDKIIDEMATYIGEIDVSEDLCNDEICYEGDNCNKCIKDYFTNKVEKEGK